MCNNEVFGKFDKSITKSITQKSITQKSITPEEVYNLGYKFFSIFHLDCSYNDVKPDNFVICGGKLKFIDFGFVQKLNQELSSLGTDGFMSPIKYLYFSDMDEYEIVNDITPQIFLRIKMVFQLNKIYTKKYEKCIQDCCDMIESYILGSAKRFKNIIKASDRTLLTTNKKMHRKNDEFALFVTIFIFSINYLIKKHVSDNKNSNSQTNTTIKDGLHSIMEKYKFLINSPDTIYEKNKKKKTTRNTN